MPGLVRRQGDVGVLRTYNKTSGFDVSDALPVISGVSIPVFYFHPEAPARVPTCHLRSVESYLFPLSIFSCPGLCADRGTLPVLRTYNKTSSFDVSDALPVISRSSISFSHFHCENDLSFNITFLGFAFTAISTLYTTFSGIFL